MRRKTRYGYTSYRGARYRGPKRSHARLWAVLAVIAVVAVTAAVLTATGSVVFTDDGPVFTLFKGKGEKPEPPRPSNTPQFIIDDKSESTPAPSATAAPTPEPTPTPVPVRERPERVCAVYIPDITSDEAVEGALGLARAGLINAVVLELKHDDGSLAFISSAPDAALGANPATSNAALVIRRFKSEGIHVIAQLCAFEDTITSGANRELTVATRKGVRWLDWQYHGWLDPYKESVRSYITALVCEAAELGADEILLDKFCFPIRGKPQLLYFEKESELSRSELLAGYAGELAEELKNYGASLSVAADAAWFIEAPEGSGFDASALGANTAALYASGTANTDLLPEGTGCVFPLGRAYYDVDAGAAAAALNEAAGERDIVIYSADGRYPASWE